MIGEEVVLALIAMLAAIVAVWFTVKLTRGPPHRESLPTIVKPVCGCGHHFAFHDLKTGRCNEYIETIRTSLTQCRCQHYSGPEPLPEYFVPELDGGG